VSHVQGSGLTAASTPICSRALLVLLVAYGAASLLHFAHNAEFLADYPNIPASLSRASVYAAWLVVTALGVLGYLLLRRGLRLAGLGVIAVYALLGFGGLTHYGLAPPSEHTATMNATIWLEAATAALLLAAVLRGLGRNVH
jgi:hypothetical protein